MADLLAELPEWAQREIRFLRGEVERLLDQHRQQERAHAVLLGRVWFTITGPLQPGAAVDNLYHLGFYAPWAEKTDLLCPACSLGVGDVLLVGRAHGERERETAWEAIATCGKERQR